MVLNSKKSLKHYTVYLRTLKSVFQERQLTRLSETWVMGHFIRAVPLTMTSMSVSVCPKSGLRPCQWSPGRKGVCRRRLLDITLLVKLEVLISGNLKISSLRIDEFCWLGTKWSLLFSLTFPPKAVGARGLFNIAEEELGETDVTQISKLSNKMFSIIFTVS